MTHGYVPTPADVRFGAATDVWVVVIPVKRLPLAKTRLAPLPPALRHELALAMAIDTIDAAVRTPAVRVVVVTDDTEAAAAAYAFGATVTPDVPGAGINGALLQGAGTAGPGTEVAGFAALTGDLPALRPAHLARALGGAAAHVASYVPDRAGTGTVLYAATSLADFRPAFGPDSRARHGSRAVELAVDGLDSLRQDVDTLADLEVARALGLGPRTAAFAPRINDWMAGSADRSWLRSTAADEDRVCEGGRSR